MNASELLDLANRYLSAAEECIDYRAKGELRDIAKELIRKANELPGAIPVTWIAQRPRRLHS
jgi:hypothetical protein